LIDAGSPPPLRTAILNGYFHVVSYLLEAGANPQANWGPLSTAARSGHLRIVELLLRKGADPNRGSALIAAAEKGYKSIAELLIKSGADPRAANNGVTALHHAVWAGMTEIAQFLIQAGADVNAVSTDSQQNFNPPRGIGSRAASPLHLAAARGDTETAAILIKAGARVDAVNAADETPLFWAVALGETNVMALLLANGTDVNKLRGDQQTPLALAVVNNKVAPAELLLARGADVNKPVLASWTQPQALTRAWNPNFASPVVRGTTHVIHLAAGPEMLTALLKSHPFLEVTNAQQQTPAQKFADNPAMLRPLLEAGASPTPTNQSFAPIGLAVLVLNVESTELLLKRGAKPNISFIQLGTEYSPLSFAEARCREASRMAPSGPNNTSVPPCEIARLLRDAGADPHLLRSRSIAYGRDLSRTSPAFTRGTNDWNRYTLFEIAAQVVTQLEFPDLQRAFISRITNGQIHSIPVNLAALLTPGECTNDMWLEWGDVVVVPERDHPINERKDYLPEENRKAALECIERTVSIVVKGSTNAVRLKLIVPKPGFAAPLSARGSMGGKEASIMTARSFRAREVILYSDFLRASSDQARIKVTRSNPNGAADRWTINLLKEGPEEHDLWLRDGDVIEIPEKQ
jgi:ankyrin repeat protein